jgi:ankyrin repeat protein
MVNDSRAANGIFDKHHTILHIAVLQENISVVQHLISRKANVNAVSVEGDPPLFLAASTGNLRTIKMLLDAGANINLPSSSGELAVQHATKRAAESEGRKAVARYLRNIYEAKAAELPGELSADRLIAQMAAVWNQRRTAYAQQARAKNVSTQERKQVSSDQVMARRQATLQAAQAQAATQKVKMNLMRDVKCSRPFDSG